MLRTIEVGKIKYIILAVSFTYKSILYRKRELNTAFLMTWSTKMTRRAEYLAGDRKNQQNANVNFTERGEKIFAVLNLPEAIFFLHSSVSPCSDSFHILVVCRVLFIKTHYNYIIALYTIMFYTIIFCCWNF